MRGQTTSRETPFVLMEYEVVSKSPISDPLNLSRTTVEAPSQHEALEYLIDAAGWRECPERRYLLIHNYVFVDTNRARHGRGMNRREWINSTLLGYIPHPVSLVEGVLTGPAPERPAKSGRRKSAVTRGGLMSRVESFFRRQANFPRTWKAVGLVLAVGAGLALLYLLWQVLLSLVTVYIVARAVGASWRV